MILYVNACVREESRTKRLADHLIQKLEGEVKEISLAKICFPNVDEGFLRRRDCFIQKNDYSDEMFDLAKDFAMADTIVIAAPFWDLSFPAALKQYFEQVNVLGLTFVYSEAGIPQGLCKAKKLYYVMTAGGGFSESYCYGYVKALALGFYGIQDTVLFKAEGLDIAGADVESTIREAERQIDVALGTNR